VLAFSQSTIVAVIFLCTQSAFGAYSVSDQQRHPCQWLLCVPTQLSVSYIYICFDVLQITIFLEKMSTFSRNNSVKSIVLGNNLRKSSKKAVLSVFQPLEGHSWG
jgi:hypothetical protein